LFQMIYFDSMTYRSFTVFLQTHRHIIFKFLHIIVFVLYIFCDVL